MPSSFVFSCSNCSASFPKWSGKCTNCNSWETLIQSIAANKKEQRKKIAAANVTMPIIDFKNVNSTATAKRLPTGLIELDRVLGGGFVPASLTLLVGEPGIGKSTLVLQIAKAIQTTFAPILYVSGEESAEQLKLRFERLNVDPQGIHYFGDTNIDSIEIACLQLKPKFIIVDSMQMLYRSDLDGEPGSPMQIKANINALMNLSKKEKITVLVIGHVTKSGDFAGPKTLEHMVDCVLHLEGDRFSEIRILKSPKNRFGNTSEIGVFEMGQLGLLPVSDPAKIFIKNTSTTPGTAVTTIIAGSRVFFVEIQALVNKTNFHYPLRKAVGFDLSRLQLIIAVLKQRAGINLNYSDIHLKIARGVETDDPAADLAVALAIISAYKNRTIDASTIIFGELSLSGEINEAQYQDKRLNEAARLGFTTAVGNIRNIPTNIHLLAAPTLEAAIRELF